LSKIEVNAIEPQCGTNLTVGASGDTITFPSGTTVVNNGSQTGFGRTGTVDWETTPKTATFTAVSGEGYFCNTTGGAFTVNLPAGSAGAIVSLADYAGTWQTNNLTVLPNGSEKIGGVNADVVLNTEGQSVTFVYVDSTQGWINTMDSTSNERGNSFIVATGGTITCCGDFKIHTFTGPGTFTVSNTGPGSSTVDYLVIAGGGAGGGAAGGSGAGAGGYRESSGTASGCYTASPLGACVSALPVSVTSYPITVGAGGSGVNAGGTTPPPGSDSTFSTITSAGGARGVGEQNNGSTGGSGGGAGHHGGTGVPYSGGAGNTPPVSPPQGQSGGGSSPCGPTNRLAGGGGGAGATGSTSPTGNGGNGVTSSITASPVTRAGGGGGGGESASPSNLPRQGSGGSGGGGNSGPVSGGVGANGTTNTGSGGGGSIRAPQPASTTYAGGSGGSGIVIIRYKFQ
jgi:hypothetical protein